MPRQPNFPLPQPMFHEPTFSNGLPTHDPTSFMEPHADDKEVYKEVENLLKKDVVSFDKSRAADNELFTLAGAYGSRGAGVTKKINDSGKIIFHALGDTGATQEGKKYRNELSVSDQVTLDYNTADDANRPAFLFHLGDVVYDFGESRYYYDQFYDPYRDYPAPIFAIPGNHDSFIVPHTPKGSEPLTIFSRNFCSKQPVVTQEAGSLHRTAMTQPGVYFALDAPFVRILALFSNSLEDPGVISPEGERWPTVPDYQLGFLKAQLTKIRDEKYKGAVLIAVHHPPFSYAPQKQGQGGGGEHHANVNMLQEIDGICAEVGIYPHAVLSGHAHNYQRYTRTVKLASEKDAYDVPFIVSGDGGHNVNLLVRAKRGQQAAEPHFGTDVKYLDTNSTFKDNGGKILLESKGLLLEKYNDGSYGYLRVTVDKDYLRIGCQLVGQSSLAQSRFDLVTVNLHTHQMEAN
jgi:hypothetical protein